MAEANNLLADIQCQWHIRKPSREEVQRSIRLIEGHHMSASDDYQHEEQGFHDCEETYPAP